MSMIVRKTVVLMLPMTMPTLANTAPAEAAPAAALEVSAVDTQKLYASRTLAQNAGIAFAGRASPPSMIWRPRWPMSRTGTAIFGIP